VVAKFLILDLVLKTLAIPYLKSYPLNIIAKDIGVTEKILRLRLEVYKNEN